MNTWVLVIFSLSCDRGESQVSIDLQRINLLQVAVAVLIVVHLLPVHHDGVAMRTAHYGQLKHTMKEYYTELDSHNKTAIEWSSTSTVGLQYVPMKEDQLKYLG